MHDDDLPYITADDLTPEIEALSKLILASADQGQLTLSFLERALVAYTRKINLPR